MNKKKNLSKVAMTMMERGETGKKCPKCDGWMFQISEASDGKRTSQWWECLSCSYVVVVEKEEK